MSLVNPVQREVQVLDLFLTAKVREDVWVNESDLYLELEDLVRAYGSAAGVISVSSSTGNTIIASGSCPSSSPISPTPLSISVPSAARPTPQSHPHMPTSSTFTTTPTPYPYPFPRARVQVLVARRVPFSSITPGDGPIEVWCARAERLENATSSGG
ncbi:uncharacterized protein FOMMEDRAFT_154410 [Fomitiporia mediterranea MF3/22]|uniref:uncharacterized protein n=1 Tax=Fomitiporia mediterranea (strain MF3/22) TaxID=694068 RepID=UPI0004407B9C|nr:uncharacterized protein FOMMEDRAFT_154410 [Fomitiporia mediterranea MF3/22]EJD05195.1 hypothetical protein FOMMEDRAFT_154410 [Fomitiporia mediterranea MF3/22]